MDVIDILASLSRALRRMGCVQAVLVVAALLSLGGCGDSKSEAPAPEVVGQLEVNLVGQGSGGTLFRLRNAIVMVQGPSQTLFFDSESNPDATSFSAVVQAGSYSSFLQEGWRLERIDGDKTVTDVQLLSPNPNFFEVVAGQVTRVALSFRAGPDLVVTDPGLLEITLEVIEEGGQSAICSTNAECGAGQVCCLAGFLGTCQSLAPGAACPLPDLTVSADAAQQSLSINQEFFPADSCAIEEGCIDEAGTRRLLRFSTVTPNVGESDLILGDPTTTPGFEFASCHGHFHFEGYARYELVDSTGAIVATGHKQAFCLLDSFAVGLPGAPAQPRFHCGFQGLTRGWADIYDAGLDCQWVDITEVPDGDYLLRISINPDEIIEESNYDNNTVEVPVTIGPPLPVDPLQSCAVPTAGVQRECGWQFTEGFEGTSCEPGEFLTLSCGCTTPGTCSGDPMLRVCDGTEACGLETALAAVDDACGLCPQVEFECPPSGIFSLLSASFSSDQPFVCVPEGL
jgi:hypothetical protein